MGTPSRPLGRVAGSAARACVWVWLAIYLQVALRSDLGFEIPVWVGFFLPGAILAAAAGGSLASIPGFLLPPRLGRRLTVPIALGIALLLVLPALPHALMEAFSRRRDLLLSPTLWALAWMAGGILLERGLSTIWGRHLFALPCALLLVLSGAAASVHHPLSDVSRLPRAELDHALSVPAGRSPQILLFGVDGLEWNVLRPLVEAGELPNFARLLREGSRAPLHTLVPTYSPLIWNTIATGWDWRDHGVNDFAVYPLPFASHEAAVSGTLLLRLLSPLRGLGMPGMRAADSSLRRRRTFWEVFGEAGLPCAVTSWWATDPATSFSGWMATDQAFSPATRRAFLERGPEALRGAFHPTRSGASGPSILPLASSLLGEGAYEARERRLRELYADLQREPEALETLLPYARRSLAAEEFLLGLHRTHAPVKVWVYYSRLVDATQHLFWRAWEPDHPAYAGLPPLDPGLRAAIPDAMRVMDRVLGELWATLPEGSAVVVLSDHGFHAIPPRRTGNPNFPLTGNHEDAPDGVFLALGPGIAPGELLDGFSVRDVLPTLARYLGVPVAANLPGHPVEELFTRDWRAAHPPSEVSTWELEGWTAPLPAESGGRGGAAAAIHDLNQLGYVDQ